MRTDPELVPLLEASRGIGLSRAQTYKLLRAGVHPLAPFRVGGRWVVRRRMIT